MHNSSFIEIRSSRFGKGLFALKNIVADTILCKVQGPVLSFRETIALGPDESHSLQIGKDKYILCNVPFLYSNHSCKPNCGLNKDLELFAMQTIKKDEELFWDYSTSMLERHWTMQCLCGTQQCRKIVTDFDLLPEDLQLHYLKQNIVLPFIIHQLETFSNIHQHHT